jgi:hypothetical protein
VGGDLRPKGVEHVVAQGVGRRVAETGCERGRLDEIAEQKSDRRGQRFPQEAKSTSRPDQEVCRGESRSMRAVFGIAGA